uniref:Uncharacterized protein n=1 Tax=Tetraselmis sp. GSL018 TaxID=582737 RepID=A0A061QMU5_9CHLO
MIQVDAGDLLPLSFWAKVTSACTTSPKLDKCSSKLYLQNLNKNGIFSCATTLGKIA